MQISSHVRPQLIALLIVVALFIPYLVINNYPVGQRVIKRTNIAQHLYFYPNGGRELFPRYRLVAIYGTPNVPELGVLGQQDVGASIARVKTLARRYQPLTHEHILPTLEIITTVASAYPTDDGDYSYPVATATLQTWITAARKAGVYVVLDLQPGRASFTHQVRQFQDLLAQPNVGLALDPEWRLKPHELPLEQIGSVSIGEVNQTVRWLATLTRTHQLPQKLLLLHQFRLDSLPDRSALDVTHRELAYAIQMDGQGSQSAKLDTWHAIMTNPPKNVHFGWKNFYKMDVTLRSAQDTMKLQPQPWYVSYQ